jgi:hypothetical protein
MDSRRTLSIIAQGASIRSASRTSTIASSNDDQDIVEIDGLNALAETNLERRRSSRVSFYRKKKKPLKRNII